jgi:hypothetical protein
VKKSSGATSTFYSAAAVARRSPINLFPTAAAPPITFLHLHHPATSLWHTPQSYTKTSISSTQKNTEEVVKVTLDFAIAYSLGMGYANVGEATSNCQP